MDSHLVGFSKSVGHSPEHIPWDFHNTDVRNINDKIVCFNLARDHCMLYGVAAEEMEQFKLLSFSDSQINATADRVVNDRSILVVSLESVDDP